MHERCANLEGQLMENLLVTVENRKKKEKLCQRVDRLEEENKRLLKEVKNLMVKQENGDQRLEIYREHNIELTFNHNTMITTINTVIGELNNVISILYNKDQEN